MIEFIFIVRYYEFIDLPRNRKPLMGQHLDLTNAVDSFEPFLDVWELKWYDPIIHQIQHPPIKHHLSNVRFLWADMWLTGDQLLIDYFEGLFDIFDFRNEFFCVDGEPRGQ